MAHIIPISQFKAADPAIRREIVNTGARYVRVDVLDPRRLSDEQRRKARALVADIGRWSGDSPDYLHDILKDDFCTNHDVEFFSLATTDVTTARRYITYLVDFCLYHDVPLRRPLVDMCDDLEAAAYSCLERKKCLACGLKSELHHVDAVGMGNNRAKIIHEGMLAEAICAVHHTECHTIGQQTFDVKHHTLAVPLDRYLCLHYGLGYEAT